MKFIPGKNVLLNRKIIMTKTVHSFFIGAMVAVTIAVTAYLAYTGYAYYHLPLEERFYHPQHEWFKPSGAFGHGLGILGTLMILFGVVIYIARKRYNFMTKYLKLKYLLEFHIFLCTLGPILILFHTAFKFGGIVSVAFWSMVAVVASGVIGRFIYIQIPRTIEGRELSLNEVKGMKAELTNALKSSVGMDDELMRLVLGITEQATPASSTSFIAKLFQDRKSIGTVKASLKQRNISGNKRVAIIRIVQDEISLSNKISRLQTMQNLFKYWHVAHLPFARIMLIIVIIHVGVTLAFGYRWIF